MLTEPRVYHKMPTDDEIVDGNEYPFYDDNTIVFRKPLKPLLEAKQQWFRHNVTKSLWDPYCFQSNIHDGWSAVSLCRNCGYGESFHFNLINTKTNELVLKDGETILVCTVPSKVSELRTRLEGKRFMLALSIMPLHGKSGRWADFRRWVGSAVMRL